MAGSDGFDPTGMLLISDSKLCLCCCKELDEALREQIFYMRSQLFDARSYEDDEIICGSSDVCPFCGARNMLRYGHDGSNLDWTTWYRDLNVFAGEMKERLSELEAERNRLSETLRWWRMSCRRSVVQETLPKTWSLMRTLSWGTWTMPSGG